MRELHAARQGRIGEEEAPPIENGGAREKRKAEEGQDESHRADGLRFDEKR